MGGWDAEQLLSDLAMAWCQQRTLPPSPKRNPQVLCGIKYYFCWFGIWGMFMKKQLSKRNLNLIFVHKPFYSQMLPTKSHLLSSVPSEQRVTATFHTLLESASQSLC